jgi:transposase
MDLQKEKARASQHYVGWRASKRPCFFQPQGQFFLLTLRFIERLMTHPGVGPLTALAFVLIIGTPERFAGAKQIGTYVGLIPSEDSSGGRQRLGYITKQGSSLLRFLLVEAAQAAVRCNVDWRRRYRHLVMRRQRNIAKVAMGRRMGVRLYWMWRNGREYSPSLEFGSHAGELGTFNGGH